MDTNLTLSDALSFYQRNDWANTAATCQSILSADPSNSAAHNLLGVTLIRQGNNLRAAAHHFDRATTLDPLFADAHQNLALVALGLRDATAALKASQRAIALQDTARSRSVFVSCASTFGAPPNPDPAFASLCVRALREPWFRPVQLVGAGLSCVKRDPVIRKIAQRVAEVWP